ncbi:MAG: SH2 domain-containing protein, partial [Rhabdochlamydiaceae bacterium]
SNMEAAKLRQAVQDHLTNDAMALGKLNGAPEGTFLIRQVESAFILSVVRDHRVLHLKFRVTEGGFLETDDGVFYRGFSRNNAPFPLVWSPDLKGTFDEKILIARGEALRKVASMQESGVHNNFLGMNFREGVIGFHFKDGPISY